MGTSEAVQAAPALLALSEEVGTGCRSEERLEMMIGLKKTFVATAAALALMAPLAGVSHAKYDGFKHKNVTQSQTQQSKRHGTHLRLAQRRGRSIRTPRIDGRIANQRRRINRGRKSRRLNAIEAIRLRGHLYTIRSIRRLARIDGRVTRKERSRLNAMLDKNSKRIRRLATNGRRR